MYKSEIPADYLSRQNQNYRTMSSVQRPGMDTGKLTQELAAERERYLRLAAEFDNHRKRVNREMEYRARSQKETLVREVLTVVDNLERALGAKTADNIQEGVRMIYQQILDVLKRHGFEPREDSGRRFDARFHDGIAVGCKPHMPDLSIIEVWERGWMRGNELFRPAKVLVNNLQMETAPSEEYDIAHQMCEDNAKIGEVVLQ